MELQFHRLVAVEIVAARPGARHPLFGEKIENDRQVGTEITDRPGIQPFDHLGAEPETVTLIGHRRIREPVGDDPIAALQRRHDRLAQVLATGGEMEQRLGRRLPIVAMVAEQQGSDLFGAGCAAGLAGHHHIDAACAKRLDQAQHLGRLAHALAAFDGDEPAARQWPRPQPVRPPFTTSPRSCSEAPRRAGRTCRVARPRCRHEAGSTGS